MTHKFSGKKENGLIRRHVKEGKTPQIYTSLPDMLDTWVDKGLLANKVAKEIKQCVVEYDEWKAKQDKKWLRRNVGLVGFIPSAVASLFMSILDLLLLLSPLLGLDDTSPKDRFRYDLLALFNGGAFGGLALTAPSFLQFCKIADRQQKHEAFMQLIDAVSRQCYEDIREIAENDPMGIEGIWIMLEPDNFEDTVFKDKGLSPLDVILGIIKYQMDVLNNQVEKTPDQLIYENRLKNRQNLDSPPL